MPYGGPSARCGPRRYAVNVRPGNRTGHCRKGRACASSHCLPGRWLADDLDEALSHLARVDRLHRHRGHEQTRQPPLTREDLGQERVELCAPEHSHGQRGLHGDPLRVGLVPVVGQRHAVASDDGELNQVRWLTSRRPQRPQGPDEGAHHVHVAAPIGRREVHENRGSLKSVMDAAPRMKVGVSRGVSAHAGGAPREYGRFVTRGDARWPAGEAAPVPGDPCRR